ncbi:hypothetical protein DPEC_G00143690, partial [Dallia pectoralis]
MGTRRPPRNPIDKFNPSNQSTFDRNLQPISRISRETSPRSGTMDRMDTERERIREEEWRRERLKDKNRNRETEMELVLREKDRAPGFRVRQEDKEWRERRELERRINGRRTSNLEVWKDRETEQETKKGDTFPRMTMHIKDRDRRISQFLAKDVGKEGTKLLVRQKGTEIDYRDSEREREANLLRYKDAERDLLRYRDRGREKERVRAKEEGEKNGGRPKDGETVRWREGEARPGFRERRERDSEGNDLWGKMERSVDGVRERPILSKSEREERFTLLPKRKDGNTQSDSERGDKDKREGRREGSREGSNGGQGVTRSEGDSDEEKRRKRVRDDNREDNYKHSKSEGDDGCADWEGLRKKEREIQRWIEGKMYQEKDGERESERQSARDRDRDELRGRDGLRENRDG